MAELLDRVLREIRERKHRARAAVEETRRLEAALAALDDERVEGRGGVASATVSRAYDAQRRAPPRGDRPALGRARAAALVGSAYIWSSAVPGIRARVRRNVGYARVAAP